jgi:mycothiol synthase
MVVEVRTLAPGEPDEARIAHVLAHAALAADGHPSVGDGVWRDLEHPAHSGLGLVATVDGAPVGYLHAATDGGTVERATTLSLIVDPAHRGTGVGDALVRRAVESLAGPADAPSRLQLWIFGAGECADRFAADLGFERERELRQMRVALPLPEPDPRWPEGVTVRSFVRGRDDRAWLEVNNRAFAADPDQSGWDQAMLDERTSETWFDPAGFLLAFDDRGLAGFCWTKVHPADPPQEREPLGEIYVIGADPERQGAGLGRALVVAGLASLHERGIGTGMLFVDAVNEPAVRLYEKLGFTTARVDRAYGRDA